MHRPLRVPLYLRVWNLIKGLLFYNTWNWEKASDGLNLPRLSREEREQKRPRADLEIIKPREKPRAKLEVRRKTRIEDSRYEAQVSEPLPDREIPSEPLEMSEPEPISPAHPSGEYVKRRKYKKRRTGSTTGGNGFFRRVFGRQ